MSTAPSSMQSPPSSQRKGLDGAGRIAVLAGVVGFLGVAIGAFGAHGLKDVLVDQRGEWYQTGVEYHLFHAPMIAWCVFLARDARLGGVARFAATAFALGILLFSFSLYALALGAPRYCVAITPFGGVALMLGWIAVARAGFVASRIP